MEIQPRDLDILDRIGELGTADSSLLHREFFPDASPERCRQVLQRLDKAGFIRRVRLTTKTGSKPMLCFLLEAGGELVGDKRGTVPRRVLSNGTEPSEHTLKHRMDTVEARIAIDRACELLSMPLPGWIMEQDTKPDMKRQKATKGVSPSDYLILKNRYAHPSDNRMLSFNPDAACHLKIPRPNGGPHRSLLMYLEVDESTEGYPQWERKILGVEAFLNDATAWREHWPGVEDAAVGVFVLCKSAERISGSTQWPGLAEVTSKSPVANRIRFTTHPLNPETILTGYDWLGYKQGELQKLRIIGA